jgi:proliferating cell nuclear antigen
MKMSSSIRVLFENDTFLKVFTTIGDLCDDVNIVFGDDGVSMSSMDSSHVCLVAVRFSSEYFQDYSVKSATAVGIKVSNFVRVLKCLEGHSVMFECTDDEFIVMSQHHRYAMKTLDLDTEEMNIPDMDTAVEITAVSSALQKDIKNIASFGDTVEFHTSDGELSMKTTGDIGTVELRIDQPTEIREELAASFAARYLVTFAKAANISKQVIVKISNELPIVFEYAFAQDSFVKFFLAPKIVDDD